jgi:hypothetical protein
MSLLDKEPFVMFLLNKRGSCKSKRLLRGGVSKALHTCTITGQYIQYNTYNTYIQYIGCIYMYIIVYAYTFYGV